MSTDEEGIAQTTSSSSRPAQGLRGRELDALVAEKVFGCTGRMTVYAWADRKKRANPVIVFANYPTRVLGDFRTVDTSFSTWADEEGGKISRCYWPCNYSTDIEAAWQVVRAMEQRGATVVYRTHGPRFTRNRIEITGNVNGVDQMYAASAEDVPEAICLAALKSLGAIPDDSTVGGADSPRADHAPTSSTSTR